MGQVRFRHTECSGHTACPGHTGGLVTECDVQVTDGDLGHGVCVHMREFQMQSTLYKQCGVKYTVYNLTK